MLEVPLPTLPPPPSPRPPPPLPPPVSTTLSLLSRCPLTESKDKEATTVRGRGHWSPSLSSLQAECVAKRHGWWTCGGCPQAGPGVVTLDARHPSGPADGDCHRTEGRGLRCAPSTPRSVLCGSEPAASSCRPSTPGCSWILPPKDMQHPCASSCWPAPHVQAVCANEMPQQERDPCCPLGAPQSWVPGPWCRGPACPGAVGV
jgi:hypothetical protein